MTMQQRVFTESAQIPVIDGRPMGGYLARPVGRNPTAGVLVGMELFGVSSHVRDVCDRLAALGFTALAPDLYHRMAPGIELPADDRGRARGFELLDQLTRQHAIDDVRAATDYLSVHFGPVAGMVGLSVGGHIAYLAATELPLPAVVVAYGGWLTTTDIPLSRPAPTLEATAGITGRMLVLIGSDDPLIGPADRARIADALNAADVDHEVVVYPDTGHGFLCDRRASYQPTAAADAWQRIARLLGEATIRAR